MSKLFYDVPAEGYDELYGEEQRVKYKLVFDKLGYSSSSLLDIGCGIGLLAEYLKNAGFDGIYIGVDIDLERIRYAKKNLNVDEYVVADAHYLPFRDKCFQLSTIFTVIHLLDIRKAVKEALRVSQKIVVITLLKKREDLEKNLIEEVQKASKIAKLESRESKDVVFIVYVD